MEEEKMTPELKKRKELEFCVLFKSPEETAEMLRELKKLDYPVLTASALAFACRFRGVEWVKALVENGACFKYNLNDFQMEFSCWLTLRFPLALLKFSDTIKKAYYPTMRHTCMKDPLVLKKPEKTFEVLPFEERLKCVDYLISAADRVCFDAEDFLYIAVKTLNVDMVKALNERGIRLSEKIGTMLTKSDAETANLWHEFFFDISGVTNEEFRSIIRLFKEQTGAERIKYTSRVYYKIIRHRFDDPEFFRFVAENFDEKKMNKTKIMRGIVDGEHVPCLPVCEELGWLLMNRRRDQIIQYAAEKGKTECLAWLMDFKNRTADFSAEQEKAEKKMMRELNADPNSVGELKKIWTYKKLEDGTLMITSYKGSALEVVIPEKIGKDTVTVIGEYALSANNPRATEKHTQIRRKITKVTVPNTIKRIEGHAFCGCNSLAEINIPDGITEISDSVFDECKSLKSAVIPDSVEKIGDSAFCRCESLEQINIPENVTEIGEFAFCRCSKITSFDIPAAVKSIGRLAFANCESVTEFKLPRGITEISRDLFAYCCNLESVFIPDTVEVIEEYAFLECKKLRRIDLPNSVTNIMFYAFTCCTALETVTLPASIKQIKNRTHFGQKPDTVFDESPNVTAIVEPKSYAERYCKRNEIPYKYKEV